MYAPVLLIFWDFANTWWWLFLPFFVFGPFIFLWKEWRNEVFDNQNPYIMLEIRMPQIVEKPIKAMEQVFAGFWQFYDPPNDREFWFEGQYQKAFSIEIASIEGQVHFYLRTTDGSRKIMESALYAHYPEAEMLLVDDYVNLVPHNIPNKDWKVWGAEYRLDKPSPYPIKTYAQFFEENPDTREEKRVDPVSMLVESLSKIGRGEHLWIQFILTPYAPQNKELKEFIDEGHGIVDKLVKRKVPPPKPITLVQDASSVFYTLATGKEAVKQQGEEIQGMTYPELQMTPGERDIVKAIETKISKQAFVSTMHFLYLARTENYFGPAKALPMTYFNQYSSANLNFFRPLYTVKVNTIANFFFDQRRNYLKRRRLLRAMLYRLPPFYPAGGGSFVLNIEEMASLFHFSGKITFPSATVPRVEAKKAEAPQELPVE